VYLEQPLGGNLPEAYPGYALTQLNLNGTNVQGLDENSTAADMHCRVRR
jgi:hypothetical protein